MREFFSELKSTQDIHVLIDKLLESPPPDEILEFIYKITSGVDIRQPYQIGATMRTTLDPLIPSWWSENVRVETMAFLCYVASKPEIPDEDLRIVSKRLFHATVFGSLVQHHIGYMLQDQYDEIEYLKIFWSIREESNQSANRYPDPVSYLPSFGVDIASEYAESLSETGELPQGIPVSFEDAQLSKIKRMHRYLLLHWGINVTLRTRFEILGLERLYSLGMGLPSKFKHQVFSLEFDDKGHTDVFRGMVVPAKSVGQVLDKYPEMMGLIWYFRKMNNSVLAREINGNATASIKGLCDSLTKTSNEKHFKVKNRIFTSRGDHTLDETEARIIDSLSDTIYLEQFEESQFWDALEVSKESYFSTIAKLTEVRLLRFQFSLSTPRLWDTFLFYVEGNFRNALSLANYIVKNCHTSMVLKLDGDRTVIISRFLPEVSYFLPERIEETAIELGIKLRCEKVTKVQSYRKDLLQRFRLHDGSWDDDFSDLNFRIE